MLFRSSGYAPAKQYISVKSLGERLRSMEYTVTASTASTAEAARTLRRHDLARRFGDELGDIGTTALAGIVQAEEGWRKKAAAPAEAAPAEVQPAADEAAKAEAPEGGGGTKRGAEELAGEGDDADDGKRSKAEA